MCNYAPLKGKKQMEILCKVWRWARDQGKYDIHDRRYYLTVSSVDVKNICQRYKSNKRFVITFIHFDFLQWLTIRYDLIIHILEGIGINVYLHMQVLKHPI